MLPFDDYCGQDGEEAKQDDMAAEKFCESVLFSQENTFKIFTALTRKYLVYTSEEVESWQTDPLKFYLDAKNESNECKGNFLREKAQRLLAGTQLHLDDHFTAFCAQVATELAVTPAASNLPIERQVQKDAMMQILFQRLAQQSEVNVDDLISMIESELTQSNNLIVKKRSI